MGDFHLQRSRTKWCVHIPGLNGGGTGAEISREAGAEEGSTPGVELDGMLCAGMGVESGSGAVVGAIFGGLEQIGGKSSIGTVLID